MYTSGADQDTLKRRGATQGSSEKDSARTLFTIFFVNLTHENDKFTNKKEGCQPLAPATALLTRSTSVSDSVISGFSLPYIEDEIVKE